jgi:hypothetical protein
MHEFPFLLDVNVDKKLSKHANLHLLTRRFQALIRMFASTFTMFLSIGQKKSLHN